MKIEELLQLKYVQIILIIFGTLLILKLVNVFFKRTQKRKGNTVYLSFFKGIIQGLIIINAVVKIGSYSESLKQFSDTILMSSSLLVVVLGFIFQEGLSNIVHGFIILIFKPFEIGNRIQTNVDGEIISGIVSGINLRHTTIVSITDNAPQIVPNSKLDLSTIKNFSNGKEYNRYPLKIDITYDNATDHNKRELAKKLISDTILSHPLVVDTRTDNTKPLFVKVDLTDSTVKFTCWIVTQTYEDNITACSEITETLLDKFAENEIDFAFPHQEISGKIEVETNDFSSPTYIKKMAENVTTNLLKNKKNKSKGDDTK